MIKILSALILVTLMIGIISATIPVEPESCFTYANQWKVCTERHEVDNEFVVHDQLHYNGKTMTKMYLFNPDGELVDHLVYIAKSNMLGTDPCINGIPWNLHTYIHKSASVMPTEQGFVVGYTTEKYKDNELQFVK